MRCYTCAPMRMLLLLCGVCVLVACGNEVTRLDGEGCQPACMINETEGDSAAETISVCLDEDLAPEHCATISATPVCSAGLVSCESGTPTCPDGPNARPTCAR